MQRLNALRNGRPAESTARQEHKVSSYSALDEPLGWRYIYIYIYRSFRMVLIVYPLCRNYPLISLTTMLSFLCIDFLFIRSE